MKYVCITALLCFVHSAIPSLRNRKKVSISSQEKINGRQEFHQLSPSLSLESVQDNHLKLADYFLQTTSTLQSIMAVFCIVYAPCTTGISISTAVPCGAGLVASACICAACQECIKQEMQNRNL